MRPRALAAAATTTAANFLANKEKLMVTPPLTSREEKRDLARNSFAREPELMTWDRRFKFQTISERRGASGFFCSCRCCPSVVRQKCGRHHEEWKRTTVVHNNSNEEAAAQLHLLLVDVRIRSPLVGKDPFDPIFTSSCIAIVKTTNSTVSFPFHHNVD